METTEPSRNRGLFAIVTGRAICPLKRGAAKRDTRATATVVSFDRKELESPL